MKRKIYLIAITFVIVGLFITMANAVDIEKKNCSNKESLVKDCERGMVISFLSPPWPECDPPTSAACSDADVNCDGITNGLDIAVIRSLANWQYSVWDAADPRADCNHDFIIDGLDIAYVRSLACWQL